MVAVADVFDALTTRRSYKEAMPLDLARAYLVANKARQFDPACVDAFLSRWNQVIAIATGEVAAAPQVPAHGDPLGQPQADATAEPQLAF